MLTNVLTVCYCTCTITHRLRLVFSILFLLVLYVEFDETKSPGIFSISIQYILKWRIRMFYIFAKTKITSALFYPTLNINFSLFSLLQFEIREPRSTSLKRYLDKTFLSWFIMASFLNVLIILKILCLVAKADGEFNVWSSFYFSIWSFAGLFSL